MSEKTIKNWYIKRLEYRVDRNPEIDNMPSFISNIYQGNIIFCMDECQKNGIPKNNELHIDLSEEIIEQINELVMPYIHKQAATVINSLIEETN